MSAEIQKLYIAYFNRPADPGGLTFWTKQLAAGTSMAQIANSFSASAEYQAIYNASSNFELVVKLYQNLFGRTPLAGEASWWSDQITTNGAVTITTIANQLASGTTPGSADHTAITNKISAATTYTAAVDTTEEIIAYKGTATFAKASAWLAPVKDAATLATAIAPATLTAAVADAVSTGTATSGSTFSLTTATDSLTGTANNDTINGVLQAAGAAGTTIQPGDVINGGAGTDTLSLSVAGNPGAFTISALQTNALEKFLISNFDDTDGDAVTVNTTLMSGLTTVGLSSSNALGDSAFTGMKNFVAAEMRNGSGDLTLTYNGAQVVSGTADSQALTVSNLTAGGFLANGIETVAVTSEVTSSTLASLASDTLKTVTVVGSQDLTITAALDFVAGTNDDTTIDATIDASTFTGKLSVVASDVNDIEVKGGSGDDKIAMGGALTSKDKIAGGAGADTLTMTAAALTTQFTGVSGIETVAFDAATATLAMDVSKLSAGVTSVEMNLSDGVDNTTAVTGTISNLGTQTVVLKHTVANVGTDTDADGANATITGAVDTTADSISIVLDAIGMVTTAKLGYDSIDVANFETVNIQSKKSTTVTANQVLSLTDTLAKTLTITGDADLTVTNTGSNLTALNASALNGKLNATLGANKVTVTGGAKDDTFVFAGNLNNDDSVVGGEGKDTVTADASGLTATTGALKIAGVEVITLTTGGDNTLNLAGVTGATAVSVSQNTQTITGLDLVNTKLVLTNNATVSVTGANETGASDTLTIEQKLDGNVSNTITTAATVENLNIILSDTATTVNDATFVLTNAVAQKITVTEAADTTTTGTTVALGTLNKSVTTVDTSGVKGTQAFSVANTLTAATLSLSGAAVATVTGTGVNDTINVSSTGAVTHVIDAGAGTADVVNLAVKTGFVNVGSISNAETINVTVAAGNSIDLSGASFATSARAVNILGGNSASTFAANTVVTEVTSVNAGAFGGNLTATFGANTFDSTVTVTGGSLATDQVTASFSTAATYKPKTSGVEILAISVSDAATTAASYTVDLSDTTGVSRVNASVGNADTLVVSKATNQTIRVIDMQNDNAAVTLEIQLADATGTSDSLTFELLGAAGTNIDDGAILKTTDIETINLKVSSAESISLASLAMTDATKFESLVVTGDKALTVSALNANVTSINASGMTTGGSFIQTGRSQTSAATYTGSVGNDTFRMAHGNDVIDGAGGTADTLVVTGNMILGGIAVDLSATGDQLTSYNGSSNAAVQKGFENVDLSGTTGTGGAEITAISTGSTITGTANADQINGGAGVDNITGGAGNDTIVLGVDAKIDTINLTTTSGTDSITNFLAGTGGDLINGGISSGGAAVTIVSSADATTALATVATTDEVVILRAADNATFADLAAVKTRLQVGTESFAASDSYYIVFNDAAGVTNVAILTTTGTANTTLDADENLVLVATLTGIVSPATLTAANFAVVA